MLWAGDVNQYPQVQTDRNREREAENADRLASKADITSGLQLDRAEMFRGLRNFVNIDRPEHHSIDRLKDKGVEKGSGRHSTLRGQEPDKHWHCFEGNLGETAERQGEAERVWTFTSATMQS